MKRLVLILAIAALAVPALAFAKGPSAASIDGPGAGGGTGFTGDEGSGPLGNLTEQSGFFAAAFGQEPSPLLAARPKGDLGTKYAITYTVPGPNNDAFTIRQDVYPYAKPSPVTYMAPGQKIYDMTTRGGWFQAGPELKTTLVVSGGIPKTAPGSNGSSDGSEFPTAFVGLLAAFVLVGATAAFVLVRRRAHPAAA